MRNRIALAVLFAALVALAVPGAAQASITVVNQNDSGPGSLRKAVEDAPSGETIVLPAGTYTLLTEITIGVKTLTIAGHGAGDTIIRAGADKGLLRDVVAKVEVSGVTFREAHTAGGFAAILNLGGDLTLRDVVITDNRISENGTPGNPGGSGADGAGIRSEGGGSLTLIDSIVLRQRRPGQRRHRRERRCRQRRRGLRQRRDAEGRRLDDLRQHRRSARRPERRLESRTGRGRVRPAPA